MQCREDVQFRGIKSKFAFGKSSYSGIKFVEFVIENVAVSTKEILSAVTKISRLHPKVIEHPYRYDLPVLAMLEIILPGTYLSKITTYIIRYKFSNFRI